MARPKKDEAQQGQTTAAQAATQGQDASLLVKTTELLFMRDNFISGLIHLESGVHELRRAYVSQFNTLLPENHPGRLALANMPFFNPQAPGVTGAPVVGGAAMAPGVPGVPAGVAPVGAPVPGAVGVAGVVPGMLAPEANMKRKRKPHDPHAPKRALTSYFLFMQNNKPAIKSEHPDWSAQQVSDESERRWSDISEKERAHYEYMYQVDLARYYKQKECYERGEPVPEISAEEARKLYSDHLESGVPFKGRKGKKEPRRVDVPAKEREAADDSDEDDEDEDDTAAARGHATLAAAAAAEDESDESEVPVKPVPPPATKSNKRQKTAAAAPAAPAGKEATASKSTKKASAKVPAAAPSSSAAPESSASKPAAEKKAKPGRKAKAELAAQAAAAPPAPVAPVAAAAESSPAKTGTAKKGRKSKN